VGWREFIAAVAVSGLSFGTGCRADDSVASGSGETGSGEGEESSGGTDDGDDESTTGPEDDTGESDETDESDDTGAEEDPDAWWCPEDPNVPIDELVGATVIPGWDYYDGWLFIELGDVEIPCGNWGGFPECENHWWLSIGLPPELQEPGVYDILHPDIESSLHNSLGGDNCGIHGVIAVEGSLQIISIDEEKVVGRLCNTRRGYGHDMNGTFTAEICG
jgi:hypothetical protein